MSKFEIKNFFQFTGDGKEKAGFSVNTEGGMYYDCKLVEGGENGYFVSSNQSRSYDNKQSGEKSWVNAFGALKGTAAAKFFDEVAEEAKKQLRTTSGNNNAQSGVQSEEPFHQGSCTGQVDCQCADCAIPFN